jgi:hypothetical protein
MHIYQQQQQQQIMVDLWGSHLFQQMHNRIKDPQESNG